jgi:hypothetical protein
LPIATAHAEPSECGYDDDSHGIANTCDSAKSNSGSNEEGDNNSERHDVGYGKEYPGCCHRNSGGNANDFSNLFIGWFLTSLFASFLFSLVSPSTLI